MNKNPLTSTIIVFAIGDGYTVWEAITTGVVSVFTIVAWLQGAVFLFLYNVRNLSYWFLIYVVAIGLLWKQKRDYDRYIAAESESPSQVGSSFVS